MSQQNWMYALIAFFVVAMVVMGILSALGIRIPGFGGDDGNTTAASTSENMKVQKFEPQFLVKTPDEKIYDTQTTAPPAVQAGFPGNTLPPAQTNVDFPKPQGRYTEFNWSGIPDGCKKVYIGAKMKGNYRPMRALANFPIIQTPPENDQDIYGNMSIFVEGEKVGLRLLPGSMIFDYHFDYRHHKEYQLEMVVHFESQFVTRVELWIDGASTGQSFTIRDTDMRKKMSELPHYVLLGDKVVSAYLQASPE
jgi:hypothetical protein